MMTLLGLCYTCTSGSCKTVQSRRYVMTLCCSARCPQQESGEFFPKPLRDVFRFLKIPKNVVLENRHTICSRVVLKVILFIMHACYPIYIFCSQQFLAVEHSRAG